MEEVSWNKVRKATLKTPRHCRIGDINAYVKIILFTMGFILLNAPNASSPR